MKAKAQKRQKKEGLQAFFSKTEKVGIHTVGILQRFSLFDNILITFYPSFKYSTNCSIDLRLRSAVTCK